MEFEDEQGTFFRKSTDKDIKEFQLDKLKREAEKRFDDIRGFFYLIPIPACITNRERKFEEVNHAYCQLYDYEREDLIGQPFTTIVPESAHEEMNQMHDDFFDNEHEFSGQWDVMRQDGIIRSVLANAAYVEAHDDQRPLKVTFVVDVTDLTSAQKNLKMTNELLSGKLEAQEVAQNLMVHDMRNPIANILSISNMLLDRQIQPEDERWIDLIHHLAQRLERQVRSSSDMAKMEAGSYQLQTECFNLITLIYQVVRAASGSASRREVNLQVYHQGQPIEEDEITLEIEADRFYIEQVVTNLLVNALEASPKETEVKVNIEQDQQVRIQMTNTGAVPSEIRDRLFEKNITSGKKEGHGLGTYIARLIARQHGGNIVFKTFDESNQTTFDITLPLVPC